MRELCAADFQSANLVIFGTHMPPLAQWLYQFIAASIARLYYLFSPAIHPSAPR